MDQQIKELLAAVPGGVLDTNKQALSRKDFIDLTNIATHYMNVHQYDRRTSERTVRAQVIKEQSFD